MRQNARSFRYGLREGFQILLRRLSRLSGMCLSKPASVGICLTTRCNCRCIHCDIWKISTHNELDTDRWKALIDDLADWLGGIRLYITGGEPLLRRDVQDIVRHASDRMFLVGLVTNGALLNAPMAEGLLDAGLFSLDVSLDSVTPGIHDRVRGVDGTWAKAVAGIDIIRSLGAGRRASIACVLTSANIGEVERLVEWVAERDLRGISFQVLEENFEGPQRPAWHLQHPLWLRDPAAIEKVIGRLLALQSQGLPILNHPGQLRLIPRYYQQPDRIEKPPCTVGWMNFGIGPTGDVRFCHRLPSIGTVADQTPGEVWRSPRAAATRRQAQRCNLGCKILNCNFPPGIATRLKRLITLLRG